MSIIGNSDDNLPNFVTEIEATNTDDFINRYCSNLNIESKYIDIIKKIIEIVEKLDIVSENAPTSIVAGCIFLCSNIYDLNITKKDISDNCNVSQVTINKCYSKMNINIEKIKEYID